MGHLRPPISVTHLPGVTRLLSAIRLLGTVVTPDAVARYQGRLSGPLLDRIDMQIPVNALPHADLLKQADGESSEQIQCRIEQAFTLQIQRQGKSNHLLSTKEIDEFCTADQNAQVMLQNAMNKLNWSARAYHRVLKVARTIADLANSPQISAQHVAEAIQYRRALREH